MLGVEEEARCTAVDLIGAGTEVAGLRRTLLLPFDVVTPVDASARPRRMRFARVPGALALLVADAVPWPAPAPVVPASIDVLPHQLSAAIAFRTGKARRVLVADAPGSGKTIQAGIAIADVVRLEPAARVLVAVPAGLKAQWLAELVGRFALAVEAVDGSVPLAQRWAEEVEPPWARPGVFIASFDYVKRSEVLAHLRDLSWHLVVVDEAHHVTRSSDRGAALDLLCRRGVRVLLLTATPHDGDDGRYRTVCGLGRLEDEDLLLLRRSPSRGPVGKGRRTHRRCIEPSADERHARALLSRYLDALRRSGSRDPDGPAAALLLASVFEKRAASSPAALERTARRRLRLLPALALHQQSLVFEDEADEEPEAGDGESLVTLKRSGPLPWAHERSWLGALAEAAGRARRTSTKLAALRRLLRRLREPALVFTEYRDTLAWLADELRPRHAFGCLHGLQTPSERQSQLDAFASGAIQYLLATDVAAEGLNLQARCRLVIELDEPWSPLRSEQRVGRVDRLGQKRRVHAWTLITHGEPEARLDTARRHRSSLAARALAEASPHTTVGQLELRCSDALTTAKRLTRGAAAPSRPALASALAGASPRVTFVSTRRLQRWGVGCGSALLVAHAVLCCDSGNGIETIVLPFVAPLGARGPAEVLPGASAAVASTAEDHARRRIHELDPALAHAARAHAAWALAVREGLRRDLGRHLEQGRLFAAPEPGVSTPATSPALVCAHGESTVTAFVRIALIALPRDLRSLPVWP